ACKIPRPPAPLDARAQTNRSRAPPIPGEDGASALCRSRRVTMRRLGPAGQWADLYGSICIVADRCTGAVRVHAALIGDGGSARHEPMSEAFGLSSSSLISSDRCWSMVSSPSALFRNGSREELLDA